MKKIVSFLLIGLIVFSCCANNLFKNDNEFEEFFTYYYLNPQIAKVIPSINYYVSSSLYSKANSRMSIAHFYAYIFKNDVDLLNKLYENQNQFGTSDSKIFTLNIFWLVNHDMSKNLIKKAKESWTDEAVQRIIARMQNASTYDVLRSAPKTAADLDNLWGIFLATGSEEAIKKIISVLHLREEGHGMEIVLGGAAQWSLKSNATQHKKVLDIVKNEVKKSTGTTKKLLEEIIANAVNN